MPDWLKEEFYATESIPISVLILRLFVASILGLVVAGSYHWKKRKGVSTPGFGITLVLLSVLIAMVMQVIDDRVARAFSLVGALSIVRFRTVLDETQDIAFVIFSVVVGMAIGTGAFPVAAVGTIIVLGVLLISDQIASSSATEQGMEAAGPVDAIIIVRSGMNQTHQDWINELFQRYSIRFRLTGAETARGGAAYDWTYTVRLKSLQEAPSLLEQLSRQEGIQSVEMKMRDSESGR